MTLGMYGDGGSMRGSGIDTRDILVTFTCKYCWYENEDVEARAEGYAYWAICDNCEEEITGETE